MYKFGKTSKKKLEGVHPDIIKVLDELIKLMDVTVVEGLRTQERQNKLYADGASKTTKSKHILGKAVDIAPYPINWDDKEHFYYMCGMIRGIAHSLGIKIRVGADWDSDGKIRDQEFDDLVHFELLD